MAADLVRREPAVIAANTPAVMPAKKATSTIPIVFFTAADPVEAGFVASLNRPGGNLTGISGLQSELGPKRLELLHELVPKATTIALLVDPNNVDVEKLTRDVEATARSLGLEIHVLRASTERDLNGVFARLADTPSRPLVIAPDAFFVSQSETLARLGLQYAVPTIFQLREFAAAGGLMSYGSNPKDSFRQVGIYAGRILRGEKPADLPVQQPTKFELVINLKTAKALGLEIPTTVLARADEVIESRGASSAGCSAGRQPRGRSRRARSRSGCGESACSRLWPRTIRKTRRASRHSSSGCSNWAGPTATMCGLTIALRQPIPKTIPNMQRNWSH